MASPFQRLLFVFLSTSLLFAADDKPSTSGQWVRVVRKDPASGVESAAYALSGQTIDLERHPSIVLTCDGEREPTVIYHSDVKLAPQAHNIYHYYAGSIWANMKVDNGKVYRAVWEIIPGDDLSSNRAIIDQKTVRSFFAGEKLRVRFRDYQDEEHVDVFALPGLDVADLQKHCAAKWLAKNDLLPGKGSRLSRSVQ
jgi:hypothetical protein